MACFKKIYLRWLRIQVVQAQVESFTLIPSDTPQYQSEGNFDMIICCPILTRFQELSAHYHSYEFVGCFCWNQYVLLTNLNRFISEISGYNFPKYTQINIRQIRVKNDTIRCQ